MSFYYHSFFAITSRPSSPLSLLAFRCRPLPFSAIIFHPLPSIALHCRSLPSIAVTVNAPQYQCQEYGCHWRAPTAIIYPLLTTPYRLLVLPCVGSGFVVSDWGACHSTNDSLAHGLDIEMPEGKYYTESK